MDVRESAAIAMSALRANKLRSFLTLLGTIIGVAAVISVVSLVQGMNEYVSSRLLSEGSDVFWIDKIGFELDEDKIREARRRPDLTFLDADAVADALGDRAPVKAEASAPFTVAYRGEKLDGVNVRGVHGDYQAVDDLEIAHGRALAPLDLEQRRPFVVLGDEVARELFGALDPVGRDLDLGGRRFTVVGIAAEKGSLFGQSQDRYAIVPLFALEKLVGRLPSLSIGVKAGDAALMPALMDEARSVLRARRHVRLGEADNFGITTAQAFMDLWRNFTTTAFIVVIGVASISLVVGGIVIMNTLLVSVTERTREIGVRKALGARRRDILLQFLVEAVTLALSGGAIGLVAGIALALLVALVSPLPAAVSGVAVALGIFMSVGVGVFFGVYPAARAARLDPVEALRHE